MKVRDSASMSAIAPRDRSPPNTFAARKPVPGADYERFRRRFEEAALDDCESPADGSGCRTLANDPHDPVAMGSVALSCVPAVALESVMLDYAQDPGVDGKLSRSAELAELAEQIVERVLICPDRVGGATAYITLNRVVFGSASVSVSCRDDTLSLHIVSDRLRSILQLRGQAFARDLSDRLGMRVTIAVVGRRSLLQQENCHRHSSGSEATFRYSAEKSS
ncbi:hypothetical protein GA0061099_10566 [Bradyrhizobium yuanmingense]|uniref:Uncharacterized protein n=1 Tax=Bradyrhizobium yuanmingense TaxID=108015 RepID=A0A1C3XLZ8_9BRAD|nr:hypothetical protein [Bradyrhizobium yuanmingense]TWI16428.1 hypothetical protein IQ15_07697 [Bradyrhizobium yuanmingense]SCB53277.1 hypothetical protein GA0061099_10566 [Bradyrhizobium yuanmingense]